MERFHAFCRLIRFDKRGTGLSDRVTNVASLEERSDDIRAVMDAAGSERAVILGASEGGSMACVFAATYPNCTHALIVWGGQARWVREPDMPWGIPREEIERVIEDLATNGVTESYVRGWGAGRMEVTSPGIGRRRPVHAAERARP
jgi:pimeloyl-ACP methyl ester carboxylesterase